jgi:hypothetical protein
MMSFFISNGFWFKAAIYKKAAVNYAAAFAYLWTGFNGRRLHPAVLPAKAAAGLPAMGYLIFTLAVLSTASAFISAMRLASSGMVWSSTGLNHSIALRVLPLGFLIVPRPLIG